MAQWKTNNNIKRIKEAKFKDYPAFTKEMMDCLIENDMNELYDAKNNRYFKFQEKLWYNKSLEDYINSAYNREPLKNAAWLPYTLLNHMSEEERRFAEESWTKEYRVIFREYKPARFGSRSYAICLCVDVNIYDEKDRYRSNIVQRGTTDRVLILSPSQIKCLRKEGFDVPGYENF
nr:MAG TPA: hypothetical protein [Bacteriophage sp.]